MEKIIKCVILLIATYFVVTFFTNLITKPHYKDFLEKGRTAYTSNAGLKELKIEIAQCKNSYTKGYIKGNIRNTTDEIIDAVCIKINLYNKKGNYLGTEYYPISYFYPQEEVNFEVNYVYKNVGHIKIETVDKKLIEDKFTMFDEMDGNTIGYIELTLLLMNPIIIFTALGL